MPGSDATTSLQRTYRYLRLAIAGAVVVVFTAVLVAMPAVGLLPSLSHYYDTSANTMFVGALIAVSVCFFALSGRGAERVLLDAAATVVPLVAIVPTMISPGSVPGIDAHCPPGRGSCVPAAFDAAVHGGVLTDLIVGAMFVLVAGGASTVTISSRPRRSAGLSVSSTRPRAAAIAAIIRSVRWAFGSPPRWDARVVIIP